MRRFPFRSVILVFLLLFLLPKPSHAAKGLNPDGSLDKTTLSKAYFEGEFWTVISALEEYRKKGLANGTRDDSIYTYKYLSVVYAAEPSTRNKAESFMYLLLRMMPTIDLLDLYISDNIESIFQKVRSDFERMQKLSEKNPDAPKENLAASPAQPEPRVVASPPDSTASKPVGASAPAPAVEPAKRSIKPWVWAAIGGGVAASVTTYFLVSQSESPRESHPQTWEPRFNLPPQ